MSIIFYRHKRTGNVYRIKDPLGFPVDVKQNSNNKWELAVFYYDVSSGKTYVTGKSRFKEKFEQIKENK